jgi:hypothetical protein
MSRLAYKDYMTKTAFKTWMTTQRFNVDRAAQHLCVTTRTVYRWLSGERRVPKWVPLVIEKNKS